MSLAAMRPALPAVVSGSSARWYQDAIIYQLHVRSFSDSNADGIGDFKGVTAHLDYLQDLGITAIWLLPFYPSPLRDDGYDIASYRAIHPDYGTMRDFRAFLRAAHARGLKVITELVLNHTSDQHEWFQRARRAQPGSPERDFYVWSDTPDKYPDARIIFQDFETSNWSWDAEAGAYFWHRFYSHQPDLNWDNPAVRTAMFANVDFWLDMGVDGLRLDAVPYLHEREGTNCENLPETHAELRALREHIDARYSDRMLLAEANQWPEDAVAYFGAGDECQMNYHFPLMPRMFMGVRMEDRYPLIDILAQTPPIPDGCQWAIFLRNHDELTLEMVTDEERDYMVRAYAEDPQARINLGIRRRLAPLLGNDRRVIELINALLFSLPGTPIVYYGDELGMGDNIYLGDRHGVRTPMQWSLDRNAGFSRANPQQLYLPVVSDPEYSSVNVEAQVLNPNSLLWWMRRMIATRRRYQAFGRGSLEFLLPDNRKVLAFVREFEEERILVVANLSRRAQHVELDLRRFEHLIPEELMGHSEFPEVPGDRPYPLTLGPHDFFMFSLTPAQARDGALEGPTPVIRMGASWTRMFDTRRTRAQLEDALVRFLPSRRWFAGKARRLRRVAVEEWIRVGNGGARRTPAGYLVMVSVEYADGDPERYLLTLVARPAGENPAETAEGSIVTVRAEEGELHVFDDPAEPAFARALFDTIRRSGRVTGQSGVLHGVGRRRLRRIVAGASAEELEPLAVGAEQSNSSVVFGNRLMLKLFRKLEAGINPEAELGEVLSAGPFEQVAGQAGTLEYRPGRREPTTVAVLQALVPNEGDAWAYTLDEVARFLEDAQAREGAPPAAPRLLQALPAEAPAEALETMGGYLDFARTLGVRTGELHRALAAVPAADFAPEAYSALSQRAVYQSVRTLIRNTFRAARKLPASAGTPLAETEMEERALGRLSQLLEERLGGRRIRVHGDYHLGQVLWTGRDVVIIDFEGEPARPLGQRRLKRSPLQDVAGMLRSFHYAAYAGLFQEVGRDEAAAGQAEQWVLFWRAWVARAFVTAYRETVAGSEIVPQDDVEFCKALDLFLLEKAVYELGYELANRPEWVEIPALGIQELLG